MTSVLDPPVRSLPRRVIASRVAAYWLSGALAPVALATSALSFFIPGILAGPRRRRAICAARPW